MKANSNLAETTAHNTPRSGTFPSTPSCHHIEDNVLAFDDLDEYMTGSHPTGRWATYALSFGAAVAIALAIGFIGFVGLPYALAEDLDTNPDPDALQLEVERTAAELEDARTRVQETQTAITENQARITELETQIPGQQKRSDEAIVELYKMQYDSYDVLDMLLSSQNLDDFLRNYEYITHVTEANLAEIRRLNAMKAELEQVSVELEQAMADAKADEAAAEQALAKAQEVRAEAQRRAEEEASRQAEQAALAQAAAKAAEESQNEGGSSSPEDTASETASAASEAGDAAVEEISDDADWSMDEEEFVAEWTSRIDAYLAGSPLAGQGRTFAQAAWDYGVDPRWSPAIAYTESSLGAYCFLPHNAWGWGSVSWDSWEEAIDAHVRGLARGYGYTISMDAAEKYCPPNAVHWYETTLGQMNMI